VIGGWGWSEAGFEGGDWAGGVRFGDAGIREQGRGVRGSRFKVRGSRCGGDGAGPVLRGEIGREGFRFGDAGNRDQGTGKDGSGEVRERMATPYIHPSEQGSPGTPIRDETA